MAPRWHWLPDQLNLTNLDSLLANDSIGIGRALLNSAIMATLQTGGIAWALSLHFVLDVVILVVLVAVAGRRAPTVVPA